MQKLLNRIFQFLKTFVELLTEAGNQFSKDNAFQHGAALSYYTVFALPAMLIIIVSAAGVFLGEQTVQDKIITGITESLGAETAQSIAYTLKHIRHDEQSIFTTLISIASLIFASTAIFYSLQHSFNEFMKVHHQIQSSIWQIIVFRLVAFLSVLLVGFGMIVLIALESAMLAIERTLSEMTADQKLLSDFVTDLLIFTQNWIAFALIAGVFALMFKYLPQVQIRFRDAFVGGLLTAVLFRVGEWAISWYISSSQFGSTYGAAGSIVAVLAWVFYTSQIIFFGAEFTYVYANRFGQAVTARKMFVSETEEQKS